MLLTISYIFLMNLKICYFWSSHFPISAIILIINLTLCNFSATLTLLFALVLLQESKYCFSFMKQAIKIAKRDLLPLLIINVWKFPQCDPLEIGTEPIWSLIHPLQLCPTSSCLSKSQVMLCWNIKHKGKYRKDWSEISTGFFSPFLCWEIVKSFSKCYSTLETAFCRARYKIILKTCLLY